MNGEAWVVYSTLFDHHRQEAAFTNFDLAKILSDWLEAAENPVKLPLNSIEVEIDKFAVEIINGLRPYSVRMENDTLFEILGNGLPTDSNIHSIDELLFVEEGLVVLWMKTFWAEDTGDAIDQALGFWKVRKYTGKFPSE